jgi:hypothetical protein
MRTSLFFFRPDVRQKLTAVAVVAFSASLAAQAPKGGADPLVGEVPLSQVATSTLKASNTHPYVGELFTLTHQTAVARRNYQSLADAFEWNAPGLNIEDWSNPVTRDSRDTGEVRVVNTQTARAYSRTPGTLRLPSTVQAVSLITGTTRTDLTTQTNSDKFDVRTPPPALDVRPLPEPLPLTFMGAVGDFNLTSKISALKVGVGESVTWTLQLTGTGNWPEVHGLPARTLSRDFTVVKPVTKLELKNGLLFDGALTEDVLLVPTKNGTYQLGPMRYTYFDPKTGKYQMITTETITLTVGTGGPVIITGATTDAPAVDAEATAGGSTKSTAVGRQIVPEAPPPMPLAPMDGSHNGFAPFTWKVLKTLALAPVALVLLYWLKLAAHRRRLTDPHRARREAREAIAEALELLDPASELPPPPEVVREQIYRWQQATARYWQIKRPVPKPGELTRAIEKLSNAATASSWLELWRDSEKTLHGKTGTFQGAWSKRARKALHSAPLADPPIVAIFFPRNLLPFAAVALFLALIPFPLHAEPANDAYLKGDFPTAEKLWTEAVAKSPTDAIARYNLSLVEAQQDRWAEAATQALSAFCLNPGNDNIRWQFHLALNHSGIDQPLITALANREKFFKVVGLLSPGAWGIMLDFASVVFALALGTLLWAAYSHTKGKIALISATLTSVALLVGFSAALSIKRYGLLADRSIAVVSRQTVLRSVPTEVTSSQKTSPLPAGSMAAVDQKFLSWSHLVFPNGQTGWVKTDMVTHLYE